MAMHGKDHAGNFYVGDEKSDQCTIFAGNRVADGVGNVQRRRTRLGNGGVEFDEIVAVGTRCVLRRILHIRRVLPRELHGGDRALDVFRARDIEHRLQVNVAAGAESVDAPFRRRGNRFAGADDVFLGCARKGGDAWTLDFSGDGFDGLEIAVAGNGEAGFDNVHLEARKLPGHL